MVRLLVMVLLSILGRQLHFHVPGTDAYAGYMMAAAGFLALAHTLKRGEHIRVTLLLSQAARQGAARPGALGAVRGHAAGGAVGLLQRAAGVAEPRSFNDISTGNDATPLWIPQLAMALGTLILLIAFVDELVLEWRGQRVQASSDETAAQ